MDYLAANNDVIRELGIYGITAAITLNAGALSIVLSKKQLTKATKIIAWILWCGLLLAGLAILITYCYAQAAIISEPNLTFIWFLMLMVLPTFLSYGCFLLAVACAIKKL